MPQLLRLFFPPDFPLTLTFRHSVQESHLMERTKNAPDGILKIPV